MNVDFADLDYTARDDSFMLKQIKVRAEIRVKENRARPIDLIMHEHDPTLIDSLNENDLQELQKELTQLVDLEKNKLLQLYYSQLLIYMNKIDSSMIQNNDLESLSKLQKDIEKKLDTETLDFEYWQKVLDNVKYKKAGLVIREIHNYFKNKPKEQEVKQVSSVKKDIKLIQEPYEEEMEPVLTREILVKDAKLKVLDEKEDMLELFAKREALQNLKKQSWELDATNTMQETEKKPVLSKFDYEFLKEAMCDMHVDESILVADSLLEQKSLHFFLYQPRDPIYFVRVLSRKENSVAHIYGYKFFLSFENLIDKSIPPSYRIEKDGESTDTELVVFTGGVPYYDIAFRIVKKEWELDPNKGYKSEFSDIGVLQLWFRFKRC